MNDFLGDGSWVLFISKMQQRLSVGWRQKTRLLCGLLLLIMLASPILPAAEVYAAEQAVTHKQTAHTNRAGLDKTPMKANYPGSLTPDTKKVAVAADVPSNNPLANITKTSAPTAAGQPIFTANPKPNHTFKSQELTSKRTATSDVRQNADGTYTQRKYFAPKYFKQGNNWQTIDTTLVEDKNAGDATNVATKAVGSIEALVKSPTSYTVKANDWQARFAPSDFKGGMVRVKKGDSQVGFEPIDAKKVAPVITTAADGSQTVHYYDLWPGVNVEYAVQSAELKENIVIKDKNVTSTVAFRVVGGSLKEQKDATGTSFAIQNALGNQFSIAPLNMVLNNFGPVDGRTAMHQTYQNNTLTVAIQKSYLQSLPSKAFPVVVDPTVFANNFGTRDGGNYISFKTDGYICNSATCNLYAGGLYDSNGYFQYWRGAYFAPYDQLRTPGTVLSNATLHLVQRTNAGFWTGTYDTHTFTVGHATCLNNFNCVDGWYNSAAFATVGDINATPIYQNAIAAGDFGAWIMVGGEDGSNSSFKNFDPGTGGTSGSYVSFTYSYTPPQPSMASPSVNGQVFVDPQVSFRLNQVPNLNNNSSVQYAFRVSSSSDGTGTVMNSGWMNGAQWTIPDGVLQDGSTYYVQAQAMDTASGLTSPWSQAITFKIDSRRGKDKTQTYDTLGPVQVDLATGNLSTSASSHTTKALAGDIGVGLDYNSPVRSRAGLVGEYWNVAAGYPGGAPTSPANMTRVDQNIDFDWGAGAPASGITSNWFYTRWSGYFVAPTTGTFYFGTQMDDAASVYVNNTYINNQPGTPCYSTICYGNGVSLQAGQVVPFRVEFEQATGPDYVHLYVKGAVNEQIVPQTWLQTGVRPIAQNQGLVGHYYNDDGTHNLDSATKTQFLGRTDPVLSFNWGLGSPVPGAPADNFMVRWTGYITAPTTGSYQFGTNSDDGSRMYIGTNNTQVFNKWQDDPGYTTWGSSISLTAGQSVPITVDYFEHGGGAQMSLLVQATPQNPGDPSIPAQVVPSSWLSPKAQVLPAGWQLALDPDGDVNYDHAKINQNDVLLTDASGDTHDYTWTGSSYKPPVNEDGQLVRNANGTLTLTDTDGRTYIFATDGTLQSVTNPIDDRKPAALQYTYGSTNSGPAHLTQITDGVTAGRYMAVYYSGDSHCGTAPAGFDTAAPSGMLCAVQTNDSRTTSFYYVSGNLARIAKPGNDNTDYQYDALGRITSMRTSLANDAIAAGVRANDASVMTQVIYDNLGRATSVTEPAATSGATPIQNTVEYLPGTIGYQNGNPATGYFGATLQHVTGSSEPNGFTQRVEYDNLFRTTKDVDVQNLATVTAWDALKDLQYSTTDPTGLLSSTIYDDEDRPVSQYGPAPSAWFATSANATTGHTDITPQSSYTPQVPHSDTSYDQGISGPAVAWYNTRLVTGTDGTVSPALFGAPKLHTTGLSPNVDPTWMARDFRNNPAPITVDAGNDNIGFSATGKIVFPQTGTYTFKYWHDDGARMYIDDTAVFAAPGDWNYTNETQMVSSGTFAAVASKAYRFRLDFANRNAQFAQEGWMAGPGIADTSGQGLGTNHWGSYIRPDYSLQTSTTTYDAQLGNNTTTTNYGSTPELGLAQSTTLDPNNLNLTSNSTYEAQGTGFLRQTASYLPGATTTNAATGTQYAYYGATETRQNPCNSAQTFQEGGMLKLKTEPSPNGGTTAGRSTETVYDDAGNVVATRLNSDAWTCMTYDARGRVLTTVVPTQGAHKPARTITNNYAVGGNPLATATTDPEGTISTTTDLLGRTVTYTDVYGDVTTSSYDTQGHLTQRVSPMGTEVYLYDQYDRLTDEKFNGTTYAHVTYDAYSRIASVDYPGNQHLSSVTRDTLGRVNGMTYALANGQTESDQVTRATTGDILSGTELGQTKSYAYDTAGRLTNATIGANTYSYGYGTEAAGCTSVAGNNPNAGKNSNRTTQTVNGATTTYCYNGADQLVSSSDPMANGAQYDAHGNTTVLGTNTTPLRFYYDASDRSVGMEQYDSNGNGQAVYYDLDAQGRIAGRYNNSITNWDWVDSGDTYYDFTAAGDTPDYVRNNNWDITEEYLQLPGNVLVTIRPQQTGNAQTTFSLPNLHGDIFATTNAAGALVATTLTGPYGEKISGQTTPANTSPGATYSYEGQNQKLTESQFLLTPTQMGARVYLPSLGRFIQVDPVQGGTPNSYVYPPDPVNDNDLTGTFGWKSFASITSVGSFIPGPIGMAACAVSAAAYAKAGDKKNAAMMATTIALAAVGAGFTIKAAQASKAAAGFRSAKTIGGAMNHSEHLAMKVVQANPKLGNEILKKQIGDPQFRRILGWRKMEYTHRPLTNKGQQVTIHYFYNVFTRSVRQLKVKR